MSENKRFIRPNDEVASALECLAQGLWSANELDRNAEHANVVDGLFAIARALDGVASAVRDIAAQREGAGS